MVTKTFVYIFLKIIWSNQLYNTKLRKKYSVEITDDINRIYAADKEIKFKTAVLNPNLCDNSGAYVLENAYAL